MLQHLFLAGGEPGQRTFARDRPRKGHASASGEPCRPSFDLTRTDLARGGPAVHQELTALVAAPVQEQLPGKVQPWLEGAEGAERLRQKRRCPKLSDSRFPGEPGRISLGERELDSVVGRAPFVGERA